jgi:transposase
LQDKRGGIPAIPISKPKIVTIQPPSPTWNQPTTGMNKSVLPKRWIVERIFAWLEEYRRLWKNGERKIHSTHQMTVLAFIALLLRRF